MINTVSSPQRRPLILMADDNSTVRRMLRRLLEYEGYDVQEAENGLQALEIFDKCQPNLVLLDAIMPGISGFEVCEKLQKLPAASRTPILMITSMDDPEGIDRAFKAGAVDYITKPVEAQWAVLSRRIRRLIVTRQAEEALEKSEERFRLLFDNSPDALILADPHDKTIFWRIVDCNQAACDMNGFTREELIGQSIDILNAPIVHEGTDDQYRLLHQLRREGTVKAEAIHRRKDGSFFPIQYSASLVVVDGQELVFSVDRDITEQKKAEEDLEAEHNLLRALIDNLPDYIFVKDLEGRFVLSNTAHASAVNCTADEIVGKTAFDLWPQDLAAQYHADDQGLMQSGEPMINVERRTIDASGRDKYVLTTKVPLRDKHDKVIGLVGISRDITDRKHQEVALVQTMKELTRSNQELQQFAYVASHDLQEPLRMVASYMQLLSRRYKGQLDADADDFIGFAVDGANRMQQLIRDLLAYSRVGTQGKPFETVNCEVVLSQVLNNLEVAIGEREAEITHDPLPTLMGDPVQLSAVLQNLIGNAIKFQAEGKPHVHISAQQKDEEWAFSVKDNGIGIAPEYQDRIFIIFKRLHTSKEYPGTGIGLAICKKIIDRHGGRIWVESQPGQGATFYFTIPMQLKERAYEY